MYVTGQTQAVRQIYEVENGQVVVHLPANFTAKKVEVIVLPVEVVNRHAAPGSVDEPTRLLNGKNFTESDDQPNKLLQRVLAWDTSGFDAEQMQAYHRLCALLLKGRKPDEPRIFGAFAGLVWMADDFNTMSEEELDLFYADINTNTDDTKVGL